MAPPEASPATHDVLAIGHALVDVLTHADDGFLDRHGLEKGSMALIGEDDAHRLYDAMGPGVEVSGGAAANTAAGVASLGGRAAFAGRVRDDQLGEVFTHDIRAAGVDFPLPPARAGAPTGRCLVVVTPDAERTMSTFLGAAVELTPDDLPAGLVEGAAVTFVEGFLWDPPSARATVRVAIDRARAAGRTVAFSLSDAHLVKRHRPAFSALLEAGEVDVLFANEREAQALFGPGDLDGIVRAAAERCRVAVVTCSAAGSVVACGGEVHEVRAAPTTVVDATGAGDLYAAGFLVGLVRGMPLPVCGELGALAAAEVLSHLGARPARNLAELAGPLLAR